MLRLQKHLAEAGVASRRASEQIILAGRVAVNGKAVLELGTKVDPVHDRVTLDGQPVRVKRKLYVAVNKPRGVLCTRSDPEARHTIGGLLPKEWSNVYPVGRLDRDSEGLIFLTNDGEFALRLTHPRYGTRKIYRVVVEGRAEPRKVGTLTAGVVHDGERLTAKRVRILLANNTASMLEIELAEGKNREIRRMMEALNLVVLELKRTQIGPIKLGELPCGRWRALTVPEVKSLMAAL
ncbi:MAG TPA: pseudouridine synthase [Verrucomicrobiae bacterium]|jgi:pseudouridine synthase